MSRVDRQQTRTALEIVEEAVHLLRTAPITVLARYYVGAMPFVLGLLYFWADMSRSPFAPGRLAGAALAMTCLFLWMKCWQSIFLRQLRGSITGTLPPLTPGRCWHIVVAQTFIQPTGFFLLPLAAIPVLPLGYVYACYQNVSALSDGEPGPLNALVRKSMRQAALWPKQNSLLLLTLFGFGFFVWLNFGTACYLLPGLLKMLLGMESVFTRSGLSALNTTFFAAILGFTYLGVDPILKASYALRCFYGESIESGADLRGELKQLAGSPGAVAGSLVAVLVLLLSAQCAGATGQSPVKPAADPAVAGANRTGGEAARNGEALNGPSPQELDRAIHEVIQQRKYTWRLPREIASDSDADQTGIFGRFLERVGVWLRDALKTIFGWVDWLMRRLFANRQWSSGDNSSQRWILFLYVMVYVLVAAVIVGLALLLLRVWRRRRQNQQPVAAEALQIAPDLRDEDVGADQLPEDGWMRLARELLAQGELRLALRALYLSSLAHLAGRELISLARFKSNRDYERELARRGHAFPELLCLFTENVAVIDRAWYGMHDVSRELVERFAANVDRLKGPPRQEGTAANPA
jgi:hypothetical protein